MLEKQGTSPRNNNTVSHCTSQAGITLLEWARRRGDTPREASLNLELEPGGRQFVIARERVINQPTQGGYPYTLEVLMRIIIEVWSPTLTDQSRRIRRQQLEYLPPIQAWRVRCPQNQPFSSAAHRIFVTLHSTDAAGNAVTRQVDCNAAGFGYWRVAPHMTPVRGQARKRIGSFRHRREPGVITTA